MSTRPRALVLQQGGGTSEWYATTYNSVKDADKAVRSHEEATYTAASFTVPPALAKALASSETAECQFNELLNNVVGKCVKLA